MHTHVARLAARLASNAVVPTSTVRVVGSTTPATLKAHRVATVPPSPAFGGVTGIRSPRTGTMRQSPVAGALPAPTTTTPPITITPSPTPTVTTSSTSPASLPANADKNLNTIYQQYLQFVNSGGSGTFSSSLSNLIQIQGTNVGVEVHGKGTGDFNALVSSLESMGMQISATDAVTQTVVGMLPIADLPAAAHGQQTLSVTPQYLPKLF
jgi:hypothetical protein